MLGQLGDERIATMGSDQAELPDYEAVWRRELGPCQQRRFRADPSPAGCGADRSAGSSAETDHSGASADAGWCSEIPVVAYVVTVRDAAAPGAAGLLRPLLRRWQAGGCNTSAFRLPVVQAVIDWKVGGWVLRCVAGEAGRAGGRGAVA